MNKTKGFTIIELIVVIAIIAVLAGIVLVNVTSYINKGKDAAAKGNMTTMLTNAAVYFDTNPAGTGAGFLASSGYTTPQAAMTTTNMGYAVDETDGSTGAPEKWCSITTLKSGSDFCVDSSGNKKETAAAGGACTAGVCN